MELVVLLQNGQFCPLSSKLDTLYLHVSRVAPICVALADNGVVLLKHSGVAFAFPLIPDGATASDHALISTNFKLKNNY